MYFCFHNPLYSKLREISTMGKRENNKFLVREKLLDYSFDLFQKKGVENTTVSDIIELAEIGRGTFYNYFTDVNDIFDSIIEQLNIDIEKEVKLSRKDSKNTYEYLYKSFLGYFNLISSKKMINFHLKNQNYIRKSTYRSKVILSMIRDLMRDMKYKLKAKEFDNKHDFLLLSFMLVGTPPELFVNTHLLDLKISNEELASFLTKMYSKVLNK